MRKGKYFLVILAMVVLCSGCARSEEVAIEDVYDNMIESNQDSITNLMNEGKFVSDKGKAYAKGPLDTVYLYLRVNGPYVMILSVIIGCVMAVLARRNKKLQRFAIFTLCVGVPLLVLVVIFGYGFLCSLFF